MDRLDHFLYSDDVARFRAGVISMALGFATGVTAEYLMEVPFHNAAFTAVGIVGAAYISQIWLYCQFSVPQLLTARKPQFLGLSRRFIWTVPSLATLFLLGFFPIPVLEASITDRRLRQLTGQTPLDRKSIHRIRRMLEHSMQYKLDLPQETISAAKLALSKASQADPSLEKEALVAAASAASYGTLIVSPELAEALADTRPHPELAGCEWAFFPIATNTGPDNYMTIGLDRPPHIAEMRKMSLAQPVANYTCGPRFFVVQGMTATLDDFFLKRVIFKNMKLIYRGGPLSLEHVYFANSQIQVEPSPIARQFLSAIRPGEPVNFTFRP